jgi:serine/threonine protein kinase
VDDDFRRGDVIVARYELHEVVGSGAGGRIFLAFDRNLGGRETAVKIFEPDTLIADLAQHVRKGTISRDVYEGELSNIYARFRQEAIRISRLDHPAIVKVYDYRDTEYEVESRGRLVLRNRPFLAMEFIKGQTLEEVLATRRMAMRDALEVGAQVADGLAFAHTQNLVHRDLKPSNIMVEETPLGTRVRIIDWGVAKVVASEAQANMTRIITTAGGDADIHTRGILLGTPKFIAPEHFGNTGATWSPASDVFALGMFLFRMVTGQPVRRESYIGECLTAADRDLLVRTCAATPEVASVVRACLSENREDRPSGAQVRDQLRRVLLAVNDSARNGGAPSRPAQPINKEDVPTSAMTATVLPDEPEENTAGSDTDFEVPARRGPGWIGAVVALAVGVGGGVVGAAYFAPTAPAAGEAGSGAPALAVALPPPGGPPAAAPGPATPAPAPGTGAPPGVATPVPPAAPPAAPPDPNRVEIVVKLESVPKSKVEAKGPEGYVALGTTPLDLTLTNRFEARQLRFVAAEDSSSFNPAEQNIFAIDYLAPEAPRLMVVKLPCANVFDPKCNDYEKKFKDAFEKEAGQ